MARPVDKRSQTSLAKAVGLSLPGFQKALKDGRAPVIPEGAFDVVEYVQDCRREISANTRPALSHAARKQQAKPVADVQADPVELENGSLAEAARQLEWEKVREKRLKVDREEGILVDVTAVNAHVAGMIILARDELVRIGPELRERLAQESDPIACEVMVVDRISQVLKKLKEFKPAAI